SQLRIVTAVVPFVMVFGTIIDQQQHGGAADAVGKQVQKGPGFVIDPVQIFENYEQRLVERFPQQDALDGLKGAPPPNLRIHMHQGVVGLGDSQQRTNIGNCVLESAIQREQFAVNLLSTAAFVVTALKFKISPQQ